MTVVSQARAAGVASSRSTWTGSVSARVPARAASSNTWSGGPSVRKNDSADASSYGASATAGSVADRRVDPRAPTGRGTAPRSVSRNTTCRAAVSAVSVVRALS